MDKNKISKLSNTELLKYSFWEAFNVAARNNPEFSKVMTTRLPRPNAWYDIAIGLSAYHICLTLNTVKKEISAGIYFEENRDLYEHFKEYSTSIEDYLGQKLTFTTAKKDARFRCFLPIDVTDKNQWPKAFAWLIEMSIRFQKIHHVYGY